VNAKETELATVTSEMEIQNRNLQQDIECNGGTKWREDTDGRQHDWRQVQEDKVWADSMNGRGFVNWWPAQVNISVWTQVEEN
jgi:hypothetical protein